MKANEFATVFESVNASMKSTKVERNLWKEKFHSLNKLLREAQSREGKKITTPIFAQFGITEHINAEEMLALLTLKTTDKKGNVYPAYVTRATEKDEKGNAKKDEKGNIIYKYNLSAVRPNAWTLDKLVKCLASSKA